MKKKTKLEQSCVNTAINKALAAYSFNGVGDLLGVLTA